MILILGLEVSEFSGLSFIHSAQESLEYGGKAAGSGRAALHTIQIIRDFAFLFENRINNFSVFRHFCWCAKMIHASSAAELQCKSGESRL